MIRSASESRLGAGSGLRTGFDPIFDPSSANLLHFNAAALEERVAGPKWKRNALVYFHEVYLTHTVELIIALTRHLIRQKQTHFKYLLSEEIWRFILFLFNVR